MRVNPAGSASLQVLSRPNSRDTNAANQSQEPSRRAAVKEGFDPPGFTFPYEEHLPMRGAAGDNSSGGRVPGENTGIAGFTFPYEEHLPMRTTGTQLDLGG